MTVASTALRKEYTGNDSATTFGYDWKINSKTELSVYEILISTGAETLLTVDSDYTVTGVANDSGGNIVFASAVPSTKELVIIPNVDYSQETDFTNQNSVKPQEVEDMGDRLSIQIKQLAEEMSRAVKATPGSGDNPSQVINQINADAAQVAADKATTEGYKDEAAVTLAQIQTIYDNFDDRYLGAKTSDPSVDNDGNALTDGALYFNTTSNLMRIYDLGGTAWNDVSTALIDGSVATAKLANNAVTNAQAAQMPTLTLKGNDTCGDADPQH